MAAKAPKEPTKAPNKEAEGVVWVASTGITWKETPVTVEKLKKYAEGPYGDALTQKQRNLIFRGQPTITALDPKGEPDPEASQWLTAMAQEPAVSLYYAMQRDWFGTFWYGPGLSSIGMAWQGNEYRVTEIRYLPPDSFSTQPTAVEVKAYNPILPGIVLTKEGTVEYHQVQDETSLAPVKVDNVFEVHDPIRPELGSRPTVLAVTSVFAMLDYLWAAQMQRCHRVGAPLLFIKIHGARTRKQLGGKVPGDVEYAKLILKNWGKNTGYALRENMELIDPHITDTADNLETIEVLSRLLKDHFSPSSMIAKEGNTIGGSSSSEAELLAAYVGGIQSWLEAAYVPLFQGALEETGWRGYRVEIDLPDLQFDKTDQEVKIAESSFKTRASTRAERRALYHLPPLDDEQEARLDAEYEGIPAATPSAFGNVGPQAKTPAAIRTAAADDLGAAVDRCRDRVLKALEAVD